MTFEDFSLGHPVEVLRIEIALFSDQLMPTHKIDREMEPELYVCASWLQLFNDLLTKTASGQHLRWYKWHHKNAALLSFEERILNEFSNDLFTKQEILEKERIHLQNLRKILLQRCIFWVTLITNIKEKKGAKKWQKRTKPLLFDFLCSVKITYFIGDFNA